MLMTTPVAQHAVDIAAPSSLSFQPFGRVIPLAIASGSLRACSFRISAFCSTLASPFDDHESVTYAIASHNGFIALSLTQAIHKRSSMEHVECLADYEPQDGLYNGLLRARYGA